MELLSAYKKSQRTYYQGVRSTIPALTRAAHDCARLTCLLESPLWVSASGLLSFVSVGDEPDTRAVLETALRQGLPTAVPLCGSGGRMTFRLIESLSRLLPGRFGIPEPPPDAQELLPDSRTLCLVPGLAFSRKGERLGCGGGYYDRFLSDFSGIPIGVCESLCAVDTLPQEPTDQTVRYLLTEQGMTDLRSL